MLERKFKTVGVGGTFDELHKGHRAILGKAFEIGDSVLIGLSTDEFARKVQKTHVIASYEERMKDLNSFLRKRGFEGRSRIIPLDTAYGPAASSRELEAIVVSPETEPTAHRINAARRQNGLPPLEVIVIGMVPAENHVSISTTRIRHGEIDREGRLLKP